jgi:hypothetical protein
MVAPSYGAFPVRVPDGAVVGYVHHDSSVRNRYRAVSRTARQVPLPRESFPTHTAAASALMAHHYKHANPDRRHARLG